MMNKQYAPKRALNFNKQQGWTMWSLMIVLGLFVLFAYIGLQLFPIYTTNSRVVNSMEVAVDNTPVTKITRANIIRTMNNQLYLDGADTLLDYKKDLEIKRSQREIILQVNYESRVHLFFNLSLVASFNNEVKRDL